MRFVVTEEVFRCDSLEEAEDYAIKNRHKKKGALRIVLEVDKDEARRGIELPQRKKK